MSDYNYLDQSNDEIIKLIKNGKPFTISRLGIGPETYITYQYIKSNKINYSYLHPKTKTLYNAGIYFEKGDEHSLKLFIKAYDRAIFNSDILACMNIKNVEYIQQYFSQKYNLQNIYSRALEPFYQVQEGIKPWTHHLYGKKILVINPFVESFKKQMRNNFRIFKDDNKKIFLENQEFVWYKSYQTIAGNHIHSNWFETFMIMCQDISKLDFDVALLGCGGYGLPLCNFIKSKLNKSAIYIGGGLQLLFGVMGKRWENNDMWKKIIKENDCKFIRPNQEEMCENLNTIEYGCYW